MHHIVSDGWSMGIFFRELTDLYAAFLAGQPSPWPSCPFSTPISPSGSAASCGARLEKQLTIGKSAPGRPAHAATPHRPPQADGADLSAGEPRAGWTSLDRSATSTQPAGGDVVHDAAGGLPGAPAPLQQPGRPLWWEPDRRPQPGRTGEYDRLLHQFRGAAGRPVGQPDLPPVAESAQAVVLERRAPGPALREAGRRAAARTRPKPQPPVPGNVPAGRRAQPGGSPTSRGSCPGRSCLGSSGAPRYSILHSASWMARRT